MIGSKMKMAEKKTLLIDASVLTGEYQGSQTYVYEMLRYFNNASQFKVTALVHEVADLEFKLPNIKFIVLESTGRLKKYCVTLPRLVRRMRPDFVVVQYFVPFGFVGGSKIINVVHDVLMFDFPQYFPGTWIKKIIQFLSLLKSDKVVTVSEYSRNRIARLLRIPETEVLITRNGIKSEFSRAAVAEYLPNSAVASPYILCISRFEPRKNIEAVLALAERYPEYRVVLVGSNTFGDKYYSNLIECSPNVTHREGVDLDEMINLIRGCTLFVYPSFAEGFGIPPIESAAIGAPVICSNRTALRELRLSPRQFFDPDNYDDMFSSAAYALAMTASDLEKIRTEVIDFYDWNKSFLPLEEFILRS